MSEKLLKPVMLGTQFGRKGGDTEGHRIGKVMGRLEKNKIWETKLRFEGNKV